MSGADGCGEEGADPERMWRRCSAIQRQAGAGSGWPGNWIARPRRCASICGGGAGSPTGSHAATRFTMANGSGWATVYAHCGNAV